MSAANLSIHAGNDTLARTLLGVGVGIGVEEINKKYVAIRKNGKCLEMTTLRRGFYLLLGFTFPFFWAFHATGFMAVLYRPLQHLFATAGTGWPSLVTASMLYCGAAGLFELLFRVRGDITPEWHTHRPQPQSDHGSWLPDRCKEKGPGQPHHPESSGGPEESGPAKD